MFRTRAPLSRFRRISTARLACVRPPASVHPEPGSNSPLYVCLTHSKFWRFSFSLLGCYIVCQWSLYLSLFNEAIFLSVSLRICECKSKTLFRNDQMFRKKILKFFLSNLKLFPNPQSIHFCAPLIGTAKIQTLFKLATFFVKSFEVFLFVSFWSNIMFMLI